jgi:hypothetical protein
MVQAAPPTTHVLRRAFVHEGSLQLPVAQVASTAPAHVVQVCQAERLDQQDQGAVLLTPKRHVHLPTTQQCQQMFVQCDEARMRGRPQRYEHWPIHHAAEDRIDHTQVGQAQAG